MKFKSILVESRNKIEFDPKVHKLQIKSYNEGSIMGPTSHFVGFHHSEDKNGLNAKWHELARFKHEEHAKAFMNMLKK